MDDVLKAMSCICNDCGDWFAVEPEAFNDSREKEIKCPYCQSDDVETRGLIVYH